jgi:hypothetical protein
MSVAHFCLNLAFIPACVAVRNIADRILEKYVNPRNSLLLFQHVLLTGTAVCTVKLAPTYEEAFLTNIFCTGR